MFAQNSSYRARGQNGRFVSKAYILLTRNSQKLGETRDRHLFFDFLVLAFFLRANHVGYIFAHLVLLVVCVSFTNELLSNFCSVNLLSAISMSQNCQLKVSLRLVCQQIFPYYSHRITRVLLHQTHKLFVLIVFIKVDRSRL
jgi:hypothetical protein